MAKELTPVGELCLGISQTIAPQIEAALPKGVTKERFIRTALQGIQTHRDKDRLAKANRSSFYLAVQKAASDGLILDGREAALVCFGEEVQYMPMVHGLVKLARNSGEIKNIEAAVVYKNDRFSYVMGEHESPRHEADWFSEDRGAPVGAWAIVTLASGEKIPAMLPKSKILRVAGKSKNAYQYDPNKGDAWEEWWKKTAVKNVLKYAPRSTELDRAMAADEDEEMVDVTPAPEPVQQEKPKRAADRVKEAAPAQPIREEPVVIDVVASSDDDMEELPI